MQDQAAQVAYYRWTPEDEPDGIYSSPHFGELVPGRVIEVTENKLHLAANDPAFKKATKKDFDNQPPLDEVREERRQPHREEA